MCASFLRLKPAQQALGSLGQPSVSPLRRRLPPIDDGAATPRLSPSSRVFGVVRGAGERGAGHGRLESRRGLTRWRASSAAHSARRPSASAPVRRDTPPPRCHVSPVLRGRGNARAPSLRQSAWGSSPPAGPLVRGRGPWSPRRLRNRAIRPPLHWSVRVGGAHAARWRGAARGAPRLVSRRRGALRASRLGDVAPWASQATGRRTRGGLGPPPAPRRVTSTGSRSPGTATGTCSSTTRTSACRSGAVVSGAAHQPGRAGAPRRRVSRSRQGRAVGCARQHHAAASGSGGA